MRNILIRCTLIVAMVLGATQVQAEWQADPGNKLQVKSAKAITQLRERIPGTATYFDDAYAFAILPSVTRLGLGFGGAYGKGIVVEGDNLIGTSKFFQFTGGIQGGVQNFSMIVFFKDKQALEYFKIGELQFIGQAGIAVATIGAASTPAYNDGVAIMTVTRLGLMFEFTYSGGKFSFKPTAQD